MTRCSAPQRSCARRRCEAGPTDWLVVEQARIDAFADATDDHQWIHVDPSRAAAGPFGGTIAHGYLTLSLVNKFLPDLLRVENAKMGVNYGTEKVRFPGAVARRAHPRTRAGARRAMCRAACRSSCA